MICPHCRFETIGFPCTQCGSEGVQAFTLAAQEAEKSARYETALGHWRQAVRLNPGDHALQRCMASCLAKGTIRAHSMERFQEAASVLASSLANGDDWEDGHQLQIILYDRFGRLDELQRIYEASGDAVKRWTEIIRLVTRFRSEGVQIQVSEELNHGRDGWVRLFFLGLGLLVAFWGSLWCRSSFEANRALYGPIFLTVFGILVAAGGTLLNWNVKKKKPQDLKVPTQS